MGADVQRTVGRGTGTPRVRARRRRPDPNRTSSLAHLRKRRTHYWKEAKIGYVRQGEVRGVPGAAKEDWIESTARKKASAIPSSSDTVGRRCAGADDGLVIGGSGAVDAKEKGASAGEE
jgi:hypothetical protein